MSQARRDARHARIASAPIGGLPDDETADAIDPHAGAAAITYARRDKATKRKNYCFECQPCSETGGVILCDRHDIEADWLN